MMILIYMYISISRCEVCLVYILNMYAFILQTFKSSSNLQKLQKLPHFEILSLTKLCKGYTQKNIMLHFLVFKKMFMFVEYLLCQT